MVNSPELPLPDAEVVALNQEFALFRPERTEKGNPHRSWGRSIKEYYSKVELESGVIPKLPFTIYAQPYKHPKGLVITPFNLGEGYQITEEDLFLNTRVEKYKKTSKDVDEFIDIKKVPLSIALQSPMLTDLLNNAQFFTSLVPYEEEWRSDVLEAIKRLRLQLFFPSGSYEAKPFDVNLRIHMINFHDFYPLDTGPLPTSSELGWITERCSLEEGFALHVPPDLEKLAQIKARFVLPNSTFIKDISSEV